MGLSLGVAKRKRPWAYVTIPQILPYYSLNIVFKKLYFLLKKLHFSYNCHILKQWKQQLTTKPKKPMNNSIKFPFLMVDENLVESADQPFTVNDLNHFAIIRNRAQLNRCLTSFENPIFTKAKLLMDEAFHIESLFKS